MTWSDEGYILGVNIYGENSSIISILSKDHGHHKGIIYGGTSSKLKKFAKKVILSPVVFKVCALLEISSIVIT